MMNPTPTAAEALEAAERWHKHTIEEDLGCDGQDMTDFILANKDALLSLPTPGASTSAERAGWGKVRAELCNGDWRVIDKRGWVITQGVSKHIAEIIADALNAPAAAPVAGLFEGGISWAFEVIGRGGFARNEEFADGRAMGMNPPHEMAYLYRDGIPFEPINIDLYDARCTTWVECDRHGKPLPVPAPPAGGEGG